jgi:hypothetical protein
MTNQDRVNKAATVISVHDDGEREPDETVLCDLLANLMHFARAKGYDFEDSMRIASDHFEAEACATPDCPNDADDGEGYDGYCGSCADKREPDSEAAHTAADNAEATSKSGDPAPNFEKYVTDGGLICPIPECGGEVEGDGTTEFGESCYWVVITCLKCGFEFRDVYTLTIAEPND